MGQPESVRLDLQRPHLEGWKEIAGYFGRTVRTVQRWERSEGLPVRRHHHADLASVYADPDELDRWRHAHQPLQTSQLAPSLADASGDERVLHAMGAEYLKRRTREGFQQAIALAHTALAINADYAPGYALLALAHQIRATYGYRPPLEDLRLAREYADRALLIDAASVEALQALAFISIFMREWAQGEALFATLHTLDPTNPSTHYCHGLLRLAQGRVDEACAMSFEAERLEPGWPLLVANTAWMLHSSGRFIEAIAKARALIERDRVFWRGYFNLALSLLAVGRTREALRAVEISIALNQNPCVDGILIHALGRDGNTSRARALMERFRGGRDYVSPYWLAFASAGLGDTRAARRSLGRSTRQHEWFLIFLDHEPGFADVRAQLGYEALRARTGLP